MDSQWRKRNEQRDEWNTLLRRAIGQVRSVPAPADALGNALERARRIGSPVIPWFRWLLRGAAGRN